MAALSVQYFKGGENKVKLCFCDIVSNFCLITELAATPPATAKYFESVISLNTSIARLVFSAKVSATAIWKLAHKSF